jgi:phospholipid/cholesterol/gamma-HCH transport system permease protein
MITALGRWILRHLMLLSDLTALIAAAFRDIPTTLRHGRRPVFRVFLKQVYFTGMQAFKVIAVISLILGAVIITQIISLVGTGNESLIGRVTAWVVVRELGPLLTAIIVIARSGAAIATELGGMRINGEIESLESLGISTGHYLIMPRILGVATAVVILTVYFEVISILGGFTVAAIGWHMPFDPFFEAVFSSLTLRELAMSAAKSLCFGLFLTAACCREGLQVGKSLTEIPQAATSGVMHSFFLVFMLDGILTLATLL